MAKKRKRPPLRDRLPLRATWSIAYMAGYRQGLQQAREAVIENGGLDAVKDIDDLIAEVGTMREADRHV